MTHRRVERGSTGEETVVVGGGVGFPGRQVSLSYTSSVSTPIFSTIAVCTHCLCATCTYLLVNYAYSSSSTTKFTRPSYRLQSQPSLGYYFIYPCVCVPPTPMSQQQRCIHPAYHRSENNNTVQPRAALGASPRAAPAALIACSHVVHRAKDEAGSSLGKVGRAGAQPTKGPNISHGQGQPKGIQSGW